MFEEKRFSSALPIRVTKVTLLGVFISKQSLTRTVGGYKITAKTDSDGHLNIFVSSVDDSSVELIESDVDNGEFEARLTTNKIEKNYIENS